MAELFAPLPAGPFTTIMADPPWSYDDKLGGRQTPRTEPYYGEKRGMYPGVRSAEQHYPTLTTAQISDLPVAGLDGPRHLYLWCTNAFIEDAHQVARAWGFVPKTLVTWAKIKKGAELVSGTRIGMGWYFRNSTEHCLFAVRGTPALRLLRRNLPTIFFEERGEHSSKPDSFRELVDEASPGPTLELFARGQWRDWTSWGNEVSA